MVISVKSSFLSLYLLSLLIFHAFAMRSSRRHETRQPARQPARRRHTGPVQTSDSRILISMLIPTSNGYDLIHVTSDEPLDATQHGAQPPPIDEDATVVPTRTLARRAAATIMQDMPPIRERHPVRQVRPSNRLASGARGVRARGVGARGVGARSRSRSPSHPQGRGVRDD